MEFIGKKISVLKATNASLVGMNGIVLDETKSTLTIAASDGRRKKLLKAGITFLLENGQMVSGSQILKRLEERIKQ